MKQNRFLASFFKLGEIKVFNFLQLLTRNLYEGELSIQKYYLSAIALLAF